MTLIPRNQAPPLVVLTNPIDLVTRKQLERIAQVKQVNDSSACTLESLISQAHIIVVRSPIPATLLANAPKLVALLRYGAGIDMIPVLEASKYGIAVTNTPDANYKSVAEYALGQMISLTRKLAAADKSLRTNSWIEARDFAADSFELEGKTLSIVGMGKVGTHLAHISQAAFNMRVLGVRHSKKPLTAANVIQATLDEALRQADLVVLACPLTADTHKLISAERLKQMKPTAQLINIARGPVIDEAALITALSNNELAGAALDVFTDEPLPPNSPLFKTPNILLSPHIAGVTNESLERIGMVVVEQAHALLNGTLPKNLVNTEAKTDITKRLERLINFS